MKIAISIGHGKSKSGGYDSGAVGGGYHEFNLAKEIGKYAGEELALYNCEVDVINYNGAAYLTDRINYINKGGYDLALEIHLNAGGGTGSEVYYKHSDSTGKNLAAAVSKSIATNLGIKDRGAKIKLSGDVDYFGFVRSVKCQSLLVETVFIDTANDRNKVVAAAGQKKCGQAVASAVAAFYGLKKMMVESSSNKTEISAGDTVKVVGSYKVQSVSGEKAVLGVIGAVQLKNLQLVTKAKKEITVGSKVAINKGAVYGGLTSVRGKTVPGSQLAPKEHTVSKIQKNKGVQEALLSEISSWVAVSSLAEV